MPISEADLKNWFTHHPPVLDKMQRFTQDGGEVVYLNQVEVYERIRDAGKYFAAIVVALTPSSADQTAAIRKIREAVFTANAAVACGGK